MNTNTNTSAFPWMVDDGEKVTGNKGMTLRDYFAAKAMQSLITASVTEPGMVGPADNISDYAYSYADAMLEARGK
jgi:hypothetical protein